MAFQSFKNFDLPLHQPASSLDPFSMTNDQIMEKVYETHIIGDENDNVEALFNVVANIIKHSTQIADTDQSKSAVPIEHAKDEPLQDNLSLPLSKIKQFVYQMTCDPARDLDQAHQITMKILYELERSNWGAKAAITLGAFAMEYGNLLHLAEIQATPAPLGKSLALLSGKRLQDVEMKRQTFAELNNLVKKILLVTEYTIELEKLSNIGYDQVEAVQEIPITVYWIIITITACFAYISYLKGDSEYKLELLQFNEKLSSIFTNLEVHVTKMRDETGALQKSRLFLKETKKVHPYLTLGPKRKNTFSYGIRGIDGTDMTDLFASTQSTGYDTYASPPSTDITLPISRKSFPEGFIFGTATSAYQIEGGRMARGYSAWDNFSHEYAYKIKDESNGNVACRSYELYDEDIKLMKEMNTDAYRFSIQWSRILPHGTRSKGIDEEGIAYYHKLLQRLHDNGLTPFVTLYHVNHPYSLDEEYGAFLNRSIVDDFKDFVDLCFERFGDKVKYWITLNEPYTYCYTGYVVGSMAPGRCSCWQQLDCVCGDSGTEPYTVAHNLLLAHAAAVQVYRTKYQASQNGVIGITLNSLWAVQYSDKDRDVKAHFRAMDFVLGWFMDPLTAGAYPKTMRDLVGKRLPEFTPEESQQLQGSFDFIGINYYTSMFAVDHPIVTNPPCYITDSRVALKNKRRGVPIGEPTASGMYSYPKGIRDLLRYIKRKYNNPLIYITENGVAQFNRSEDPSGISIMDFQRVRYLNDHLLYILSAINDDGVNVKGYLVWSLLDNYEWSLGYTVRFGMNFVNFADEKRTRTPKLSAKWFKYFLEN